MVLNLGKSVLTYEISNGIKLIESGFCRTLEISAKLSAGAHKCTFEIQDSDKL